MGKYLEAIKACENMIQNQGIAITSWYCVSEILDEVPNHDEEMLGWLDCIEHYRRLRDVYDIY